MFTAFLFRGPNVGVYFLKITRLIPSRPQQVRSVTSYTALPPITCVGEGAALFKPRQILLQRNDYCSSILLAKFLIWNRKISLIIFLCNDREHVAACQGNSSIPTNATIPHYRGHVSTNLAVDTLHKSIMSPTKTRHLVACALPRMTWQVRSWFSAIHKRLNLGTTAHIPKAVPDINRYTHLFLDVYLSVYITIYPYICICTNDVCLYP